MKLGSCVVSVCLALVGMLTSVPASAEEAPSFSVGDATVIEGDSGSSSVDVTITRSGSTAGNDTISYYTPFSGTASGVATRGVDFANMRPTFATFAPGETTKTVTLYAIGDTYYEPSETFQLRLYSSAGPAGDPVGVVTILDDEPSPGPNAFSIGDVSSSEGDTGATSMPLVITRSGDLSGTATVAYRTVPGTAAEGSDYAAIARARVSFGPGRTTTQISVPLYGDTNAEPDETFTVQLLNPTGVGTTIADGKATATILNDDANYTVSDLALTEGDSGTASGTITISRSGYTGPDSVGVFASPGTATQNADYVHIPSTSSVAFADGATTTTLAVQVKGDTLGEPDETFSLRLSEADDPTRKAVGTVTILDDDPKLGPNSISVADASRFEGSSFDTSMTFQLTRTGDVSQSATVSYRTVSEGTASDDGSDYTSRAPTTATFAPGQSTHAVTVPIRGDTVVEPDETINLVLLGATGTGTTIADGNATGTIRNDDFDFTVSNASVLEGDSGTTAVTVTITRHGYTAGATSVSYATHAASAEGYADYVHIPTTSIAFAPGEITRTVDLQIIGDTLDEPDEVFTVGLSRAQDRTGLDNGVVTIIDDDVPSYYDIDDANAIAVEGDAGLTSMTFTVTRSGNTGISTTVHPWTQDITASHAYDYVNRPSTTPLTFAPGETIKTVTVQIRPDLIDEPDETFRLRLLAAERSIGHRDIGIGTIVDNDPTP